MHKDVDGYISSDTVVRATSNVQQALHLFFHCCAPAADKLAAG